MKKCIVLLLLFAPGMALAQLEIGPEDYQLLGAAVRTRPAYDGSKSQVMDLIPVVRYYGQPLFARTTQGILEGGLRWNVGSGVAVGLQLAYEEGRESDQSAFLRNNNFTDNIEASASLGLHVEWDTKLGQVPISLLARYRRNLESADGTLADFRFNVGLYGENNTIVAVYAQATWGSSKANDTFYGVTDSQSAATGLPAYEPGSGFQNAGLGLLVSHDLSRHITLVGGLQFKWLVGGSAESPLAERSRSSYANFGAAYRF